MDFDDVFRAQTQALWPEHAPSEADRVAAYVAVDIEDFDAIVCTGRRDGVAVPVTPGERDAIERHARAVHQGVRDYCLWRSLSLTDYHRARQRLRTPREALAAFAPSGGRTLPDRLTLELGYAVSRAVTVAAQCRREDNTW